MAKKTKDVKLLPCPFCGKPGQQMDIYAPTIKHGCRDINCPAFCLVATAKQWNRRATKPKSKKGS